MITKYALRFTALGYLTMLLLVPVAMIAWKAFENGWAPFWASVTDPDFLTALKLTLEIALIAVPLNTVFGIIIAIMLVRHDVPGKSLINAVLALPFALSPVVVGLCLILAYGQSGWFGADLTNAGIDVIFSMPGMVLATMFVSLPFVAREVMPVLREIGTEQEQAAATLGAGQWTTFRRVTLPAIRWGVIYGVILTTARCIGEYGAVAVVSGNVIGQTETMPLLVEAPVRGLRQAGRLRGVGRPGPDCAFHRAPHDHVQAPPGGVMAINALNVTKQFGDFVALDDVSLEIPDGSLTALLGPSGSGKSTLLRVIAGLEKPDTGTVSLGGRDVTSLPAHKRGIGFVFQHYAAFKHMTVAKNIAFGLEIRRRPKAEVKDRVAELIDLVHLEGLGDRYPSQLSGGQRQRMALARALAVEPEVLLLDEPFGALDARVRKDLREWLRRLHDEVHVTTVIVTHDQEEAMEVADTVVVMHQGTIQQTGGPRELYEEPVNQFVMGFVGPVSHLGDAMVRPHDVEIRHAENGTTLPAMVERVVHLGWEVRVNLRLESGEVLVAQLTRDEADALAVEAGQAVFVRPRKVRRWSEGEGEPEVVSAQPH